ncbi:MAG: hypothetical protein KAQ79_06300 [Cyclobacteriaceae bacterium]|nr:hypothetical protein [Cyclobacteriaceae bacterium]
MNNNLTNEEFINGYLDNELTETDRLDFENKLQHDSELREEYHFQKDLIDGIKEVRRLELKSRLSNIPINSPLYQTIGFKAIAVASISAGIGLGIFYLFENKNDIQLSDIDLKGNQITITEENTIPDIPKSVTPIFKQTAPKEEKIMEVIAQEKPKTEEFAKNTETKVEPKIIQPNVIQPNVVESFDDESIDLEDINIENNVNNFDDIKENVEANVEIATIKDKRNKFHYKFFENKLYLLGNFNDMPYEILELNSSKGRSYFLYYNENFYKLNSEQVKPTPLVIIENDSLVNELKIIRLNQNN